MLGLQVIGGISAVIAIIDASVKIWDSAQKDIKLEEGIVFGKEGIVGLGKDV